MHAESSPCLLHLWCKPYLTKGLWLGSSRLTTSLASQTPETMVFYFMLWGCNNYYWMISLPQVLSTPDPPMKAEEWQTKQLLAGAEHHEGCEISLW